MAKETRSASAVKDIKRLFMESGLNQTDLAARLGITQSYLSKLMKGSFIAGPRIRKRVQDMLKAGAHGATDPWIETVARTARSSRDFREAIDLLLRIIHKNS